MRTFWIITSLSFLLSISSALIADAFLAGRSLLLGPIGLHYSLNDGIAFGMELPDNIEFPLIIFALLLIIFIATRAASSLISKWAFGLMIGGGLGNIVDRMIDGQVTDFFQVGEFPVFNTADSCISIGVTLLLIEIVMEQKKKLSKG
jgi:signal peptidase II